MFTFTLIFFFLSGFKWIGNKALELKNKNVSVIFSYEEALGYCIGDIVADKDGISASSIFIEMAGELLSSGLTIYSHLQNLYLKYGTYVSYNSYVLSYDINTTNHIFQLLRFNGNNNEYKRCFNNVNVVAIKDVTMGYDSTTQDKTSDLPITPNSQMIMYEFENGCTITLRTSGTEPKIKFYTEMAVNSLNLKTKFELQDNLKIIADGLVDEMLSLHLFGLKRV